MRTFLLGFAGWSLVSASGFVGAASYSSEPKNQAMIEECIVDNTKVRKDLDKFFDIIANSCLENGDYLSNYDMTYCSMCGYNMWDARLNQTYQTLTKDLDGQKNS
jgi:hypothetical protein